MKPLFSGYLRVWHEKFKRSFEIRVKTLSQVGAIFLYAQRGLWAQAADSYKEIGKRPRKTFSFSGTAGKAKRKGRPQALLVKKES